MIETMDNIGIYDEEFCSAYSGRNPEAMLRKYETVSGVADDDEHGVHIERLLNVHPGMIKFRAMDLARMDRDTKLTLIADINSLLGIKPIGQ